MCHCTVATFSIWLSLCHSQERAQQRDPLQVHCGTLRLIASKWQCLDGVQPLLLSKKNTICTLDRGYIVRT
ncbi:hypothetical protein BKA63DRAFT_520918 [Paraphoma chrysanthemicola]|nr:hypothetical protein BKA63DRAFT_520918 [Paraphoma chrysanthemicola]